MTNATNFLDVIRDFVNDQRTLALTGLVILDLLFGVAAAVRAGKFDWERLAAWYRTNVFPFIICYFAVWLVSRIGMVQALTSFLGPSGAELAGGLTATGLAVPAAVTLAGSIQRNLRALLAGAPEPILPAPAVANVPPPSPGE